MSKKMTMETVVVSIMFGLIAGSFIFTYMSYIRVDNEIKLMKEKAATMETVLLVQAENSKNFQESMLKVTKSFTEKVNSINIELKDIKNDIDALLQNINCDRR